jgi:bifunctional DNase/RNase
MDKGRVKLKVLGFSFNQTQTGTYGLVLAEEFGRRRLMVVVGTPEAQSIAFELQHSVPPRPLTHDLFRTFINKFKISLSEALVYKYENGVFFSQLTFEQNGNVVQIESRTSDAVAIALRTNSPIYTTERIMQDLSVVFDESDNVLSSPPQRSVSADAPEIEEDTIDELKLKLQAAIDDENYELASILRDEISRKEELKN